MAKRKHLFHPDEIREKIKASQLVNRLTANALGEIDPELSSGQVKSIEILLRKSIPDVSSIALTGKDGGPIETKDVSEAELARRLAFLLSRGVRE